MPGSVEMVAVMMTQVLPFNVPNIMREFQVLAYQAIVDAKKAR